MAPRAQDKQNLRSHDQRQPKVQLRGFGIRLDWWGRPLIFECDVCTVYRKYVIRQWAAQHDVFQKPSLTTGVAASRAVPNSNVFT